MTAQQEALIVQFKEASAAISDIDGYNAANDAQLDQLVGQLNDIARKLQASGLQMNKQGEWVTPNSETFDYA